MNINATIFVQALNFFVVYFLLRFFLFKPVVAIIDEGHAEDLKLLGIIAQQKKSIEIQERQLDYYWQTSREYFQAHRPCLQKSCNEHADTTYVSDETSFSFTTISDDEIAQFAQQAYHQLEGKIKNVH